MTYTLASGLATAMSFVVLALLAGWYVVPWLVIRRANLPPLSRGIGVQNWL